MQDDVEWSDDSDGSERVKSHHSKYKKFEVSTQSLFRKSELQRTIDEWESKGWVVHKKRKLGMFSDKVELTMAYHLTKTEIESADRINGWGCIILIIIGLVIGGVSYFGGDRSYDSEPTRVPATAVAQAIATTQVPATAVAQAIATTQVPAATVAQVIATTQVPPTNTPRPTSTPIDIEALSTVEGVASDQEVAYYITIAKTQSLYKCPKTGLDCLSELSVSSDQLLPIGGVIDGQSMFDSDDWYALVVNGATYFVHSSRVRSVDENMTVMDLRNNEVILTATPETDPSTLVAEISSATSTPSDTPVPSDTPTPALRGRVNSDQGVRVRADPSTAGNIIEVINQDAIFTIIGGDNEWTQIMLADGTQGWIATFLVESEGSSSSTVRRATSTPRPRATQVAEKPCLFDDLMRVPGFTVTNWDRVDNSMVNYTVDDDIELMVYLSSSGYQIMPPNLSNTLIDGITVEYAQDELSDFYFRFRYGGYYYNGDMFEVSFQDGLNTMTRYLYAFDRCGGR